MLASTFLTRVNYALRGIDDDAPTFGSEEANYWIETLNTLKDNLYEDTTKLWRLTFTETAPNEPGTVATTGTTTLTGTDTYFLDYHVGDKVTVSGETVRTIATITSNTVLTVSVAFSNTASAKTFTHSTVISASYQSYSLHRSFLAPSDKGYVTLSTDNRQYFTLIQPQERRENYQDIYISGDNPELINFTDTIDSTANIVGNILSLPGYYMPDDVDAATDVLPIPNPNWAVAAVASEIAFGDLTYEDKAADLNTKANDLHMKMIRNNRRGTFGNPRVTPYNVKRINSSRSL